MASAPAIVFDIGDTVTLTSTKGLVLIGCIEAVSYDTQPYAGLHESFIVLHSDVSIEARTDFLTTGVPPLGHHFVSWRIPRHQGSSLVCEEDLVLLDKDHKIGDYVQLQQQNDTKIGVISDVEDLYTLEPVCIPVSGPGPSRSIFLEDCTAQSRLCEECIDVDTMAPYVKSPHDLLHDVPVNEIFASDDYRMGDYIVYKDWLGSVEDVQVDVVVLLEDESVVVVKKPWELQQLIGADFPEIIAYPETQNQGPSFQMYRTVETTTIEAVKRFRPGNHQSQQPHHGKMAPWKIRPQCQCSRPRSGRKKSASRDEVAMPESFRARCS